MKTTASKININENQFGEQIVTVNNEDATYENLLENLDPDGEYETADGKTIVLFSYKDGFIEYLLDSSFSSGKSASFTTCTFDEIMEAYGIK